MSPVVKLAGFGVILIVSFGAAFGIGRLVDGPDDHPAPTTLVTTTTMDHGAHS